MKNKLMLFVYLLGSLISSIGYIQAQCNTCDSEIKTGSGTLVLSPNEVTCISETLTFSDIKWAENATLCISPEKTLTIQNNMDNNKAEYNLTLELYGNLVMGNPEFNSNNLIMNIHSGGGFKTTGNAAFKGNNVIINNQGNFHVSVLNLNGNSGTINILNSEFAEFVTESNLNVGDNVALIYNNKGYLEIGSQFGLSKISKYSNCGVIKTAGFNLMNGTVYNTGKMFISDKLDGQGEIYNYGKIELSAIQGGKKQIYNYGTIDVLTNSIVDMEIFGPTEHNIYGEFRWKGKAGGVNNILVSGNQIFKNTDPKGESSESGMLQNSNVLKPHQDGSEINWGDCSECIVVNENVDCIDAESGKSQKNFWYGTEDQVWNKAINWTSNSVPAMNEDIEFATEENNGLTGSGNGKGAAKNDLHLDKDRIIGNLINKSDKSLIVTTNNKLVINGVATDSNDNPNKIVVKASENESTGTLIFKNPDKNKDVQATVEFYNQAYDCKDCGYFTRSWQYFGIPVKSAEFPYIPNEGLVLETIYQWDEPTNGNKWIVPETPLQAFKGYEINNGQKKKPEEHHFYQFKGALNIGDATVYLTNSGSGVNYPGMNLIGNSFTAAIPISDDAISYDKDWDKTVYLFNTGTRDQWRKLNGGSVIEGVNIQAGTYQSVPLNLAGQEGLPSQIPSMHTFMVNAPSAGTMTLAYDKLVKNELVDGMAWRSAKAEKQEIPHIVLDVIGTQSADRVWLFEQHGTTRGFDNGWDGVKMPETDIVQLYVAGEDAKENYQVATVPQLVGTSFGMKPENNDGYTLSVAVSQDVAARGLYLRDMLTGRSYALKNGAEYRVSGSTSSDNRFKVVDNALDESKLSDNPLIDIYVQDNQVVVANNSEEDCTVSLFDISGRLVAKRAVASSGTTYVSTAISGVYVVKVIGGTVNESKRVVVK